MMKHFTNPMTVELTDEQFKLAAQLMRNVTMYLNTCERENNEKKDESEGLRKEFEYSAFLEEY